MFSQGLWNGSMAYLILLIHKISPIVLWYRIIVVTLQTNKEVYTLNVLWKRQTTR